VVEFEWDPKKAEANRRKHGVEFLDAVISTTIVASLCWMKTPRKNAK